MVHQLEQRMQVVLSIAGQALGGLGVESRIGEHRHAPAQNLLTSCRLGLHTYFAWRAGRFLPAGAASSLGDGLRRLDLDLRFGPVVGQHLHRASAGAAPATEIHRDIPVAVVWHHKLNRRTPAQAAEV